MTFQAVGGAAYSWRVGQVVRLTLEGSDAEPGRILASEVARLLVDFERAVARAAEARIRRQARTGRRGGAVETATRLVSGGSMQGTWSSSLKCQTETTPAHLNSTMRTSACSRPKRLRSCR